MKQQISTAALALALAGLAAPAHAGLTAYADTSVASAGDPGTVYNTDPNAVHGDVLTANTSSHSVLGVGYAASTASYGLLRVSSSFGSFVDGPEYRSPGLFIMSVATFSDLMTINNGTPGSTGIAYFSIDIDGHMKESFIGTDVSARLESSGGASVQLAGAEFVNVRNPNAIGWSYDSLGGGPMDLFGNHMFGIQYTSGAAFTIQVSMGCQTNAFEGFAYGFGTIHTECALDHTLLWGGLDSAVDPNGNPVGVTIKSDSGLDYSEAVVEPGVPEPASWAMMMCGFGIAGAAMRRRATRMALA